MSDRWEQESQGSELRTLDTDTVQREIQSFLDDKPAAIADGNIPALKTMLEDVALRFRETVRKEERGDRTQPSQSTDLMQAVQTEDADALFNTVDGLSTQRRSHGFNVWDSLAGIDIDSLMESLLSRVDLSDWDIESVWQMVQSLTPMASDREQPSDRRAPNLVVLDLKHYLSELYPWQLNAEYLTATIPEVLRDPDADTVRVFELLSNINTTSLATSLEGHPAKLSPDRVQELSSHLADICSKTLDTAKADSIRHAISALDRTLLQQGQLRAESQPLFAASEDPEAFEAFVNDVLDDVEATYEPSLVESILEEIGERSPLQWNEGLAADTSGEFDDWDEGVGERLASIMSAVAKQRLSALRTRQKRLEAATKTIHQKLQSYLRYTAIEKLDPPRVKDKLDRLMAAVSLSEDEQGELQLDWVSLEAILDRRNNLQSSHRQQILSNLTSYFQELSPSAQRHNKPEEQLATISSELRDIIVEHLEQSEFDAEHLKQDLQRWCQSPTSGQQILFRQLERIDWMSLIADVAARVPLDASSIRSAVGTAYSSFRSYLKTPRRWVERAKHSSPDLGICLKGYLQFTPKSDFNLQTIRHHLEMLYEKGGSRMSEAFSAQFDSNSFSLPEIRSSLEQRADLSASEVNQIARHVSETLTTIKDRSKDLLNHHQQGHGQSITEKLQSVISSGEQSSTSSQSSVSSQSFTDQCSPTDRLSVSYVLDRYESTSQSSTDPLAKLETIVKTVTSTTQAGLSAVTDELSQLASTESLEEVSQQLQSLADTAQSLASQVPQTVSDDLVEPARAHLQDVGKRISETVGQLQQQVEARLNTAKDLAIEQAETARKATAAAAWWLCAIATS
ncbi:MAG: hypothetical protein AAGE92_13350, partial [Cyanobacteria bacterium P01_G01_bin.4]